MLTLGELFWIGLFRAPCLPFPWAAMARERAPRMDFARPSMESSLPREVIFRAFPGNNFQGCENAQGNGQVKPALVQR